MAETPTLDRILSVEGQVSREECLLLAALASEVPGGDCIVEVGSYRGRSTSALAFGARNGRRPAIFAIEPHEPFTGVLGGRFGPEDRTAFFENLPRLGFAEDIHLVGVSSEVIAPGWRRAVGLLWIDGDHAYDAVARDFSCWRPHLSPAARVVFHDATDPALGPHRLVGELRASGEWDLLLSVGCAIVIRARSGAIPSPGSPRP